MQSVHVISATQYPYIITFGRVYSRDT